MGLFIYFTGNFFYFLFINSSKDKQFVEQMKFIYSFVTICKNIILSIAFLVKEETEFQKNKAFDMPNELDLDSFSPNNNLN